MWVFFFSLVTVHVVFRCPIDCIWPEMVNYFILSIHIHCILYSFLHLSSIWGISVNFYIICHSFLNIPFLGSHVHRIWIWTLMIWTSPLKRLILKESMKTWLASNRMLSSEKPWKRSVSFASIHCKPFHQHILTAMPRSAFALYFYPYRALTCANIKSKSSPIWLPSKFLPLKTVRCFSLRTLNFFCVFRISLTLPSFYTNVTEPNRRPSWGRFIGTAAPWNCWMWFRFGVHGKHVERIPSRFG